MPTLDRVALAAPLRLALPIAVYPGARLVGATVREVATRPEVQARASMAVRERLGLEIALAAMDLSVEAEAFGAQVLWAEDEIPTVLGRRIEDVASIARLRVPEEGTARTCVPIETVRLLAERSGAALVLGSLIGPFTLAGRLFGVSEFLEMTLTDPGATRALVAKATELLIALARAQKAAGAHGVVMAEPSAGLLSPRGMAEFSSAYVRRVVDAVDDTSFGLVLHNCGARLVHLPAMLASGARTLHFGPPMDLPAALSRAPSDVVLCGNLDPVRVFVSLSAPEVAARTRALVEALGTKPNAVLSSGCDVPAAVPFANLEAFVAAAR